MNYGETEREFSAEDMQRQVVKINEASTAMVNFGVNALKKNPGKFSLYLIGLLLCFFFSGYPVSDEAYKRYDEVHRTIDYTGLYEAEDAMLTAKFEYERKRGWFWSCDQNCQQYKTKFEASKISWNKLNAEKIDTIRTANSQIGILSTQGIQDTHERFWKAFSGGRRFASRQSKWDAFFMGISALQKNEKIGSYLLRIIINFVFNFTLGVIMAVLNFWWQLWGLMVEYKASIMTCACYLGGAVLASLSFAASFLLLLYIGAAGTVYVGAKFLATSIRIENGPNRNHLRGD